MEIILFNIVCHNYNTRKFILYINHLLSSYKMKLAVKMFNKNAYASTSKSTFLA